MILNEPYSKELFDSFLKDFLPDYQKDERQVRTPDKSILTEVTQLGASRDVNITVLEAECEETDTNKRIAITQAAFKVLRDHSIRNAIIAFHDGADQWRLSLLTSTLEIKDGKVVKKDSSPRRYSYLLGVGAKTVTPYKYLVEKGPVEDIKQLQERFSVEVVNKQFYASIAELFTKLIGGERGATKYPGLLKLNGSVNQNVEHQEFAVRLIGRVIFSWFLKEKKSTAGVPIVPNELLSLDAVASNADYYHSILEPLFFELLNKRVAQRHENLREAPFSTVPYLNGGLFSPQYNDYYNQSSYNGAGTPGLTHIPDSWFTELFTILEQYNFTVDENTSYDVDLSIDPEMLGRIFENLLAEINPETGESARKSTGSFYTPREIVDYMVDSSLLEFLRNSTGIDKEKLGAIISWGKDDDELHPLTGDENEKIVKALANLTILDPACGSGAFPIGILQKVVYVLQQVDEKAELWLQNQLKSINSPELRRDIEEKYRNENYDYLRKLGVIRESIFGVDIQTIATEISKLRCFLTLIIEEDVDDSAQNRGIRPLPNLDFKFVTANSLFGLPDSNKSGKLNLFEDTTHIDRLKDIRNRYFGADSDERNRLQIEFKDLQHAMLKSRLNSMGATSDLYNVLSDWNPFNHDKTEWFDSEWMFGVNKFAIVIGNPPYVEHKKLKDISRALKEKYTVYTGSSDLSVYFIEHAMNQLKDDGILAYIVTNKFFNTEYGGKLRNYLLSKHLLQLTDFEQVPVFDNVLVSSCIILVGNTLPNGDFLKFRGFYKDKLWRDNFANQHFANYPYAYLQDSEWSFKSKEDMGVKTKIEQHGTTLADLKGVKIRRGITTGYDPAFIITSKQKNEIGSSNIIKPLYKGEHIKRYKIKPTDLWLINSHNGDHRLNLDPVDLPRDYPDVLQYLEEIDRRTNGKVRDRSDQGKGWYNLRNCAFLGEFDMPKIIWPLTADKWGFALDQDGHYLASGSFMLTSTNTDLMFILGLLNSNLMKYYFAHTGVMTAGGAFTLKKATIERLPIRIGTQSDAIARISKDITELLLSNTSANVSTQETQINQLVYELYDLTPEEIAIVEGSK
jgi:hypothetical protein